MLWFLSNYGNVILTSLAKEKWEEKKMYRRIDTAVQITIHDDIYDLFRIAYKFDGKIQISET